MFARQAIEPAVRPPVERARCQRCGRGEHLVEGDGRVVCRICLFAWGHFARSLRAGVIVHEVGGIQLRHLGHAIPLATCALCRAERLRSAPSFDGWARGPG
jgi:ribosomal protein S14